MQARVADQLHHVTNDERTREGQPERGEPFGYETAVEKQNDRRSEQTADKGKTRKEYPAGGIIRLDARETGPGSEKQDETASQPECGGYERLREQRHEAIGRCGRQLTTPLQCPSSTCGPRTDRVKPKGACGTPRGRTKARTRQIPNRGVSESGPIVQERSGSNKAVRRVRTPGVAATPRPPSATCDTYSSGLSSTWWWAASKSPSQYAMRPESTARTAKVAILMSEGAYRIAYPPTASTADHM